MNRIKVCTLLFAVLLSTAALAEVTFDWAVVDNPGNAPDSRYNGISVGSVDYIYEIGKYEVTAGQYTEFLNAVAKADPNGLYSTQMGNLSSFGGNIMRTGSSPNFIYSVAADWANRPVNYVSFWDAARFTNWLQNGQPTGPQGPGTTEDGAYRNVGNQIAFARQPGPRFVIPTENEWYKAAYHDKNVGLAASYFDYPTGTNSVPGTDATEATNAGNNANYRIDFGVYALGPPYYRTEVGEYQLSDSPYGTFDQGGNVWEWNETMAISSSCAGCVLEAGKLMAPTASAHVTAMLPSPRKRGTTAVSAWLASPTFRRRTCCCHRAISGESRSASGPWIGASGRFGPV